MSDLLSLNFWMQLRSNWGIFKNSLAGINMVSTVSLAAMIFPKKQKSIVLSISASPKKSPAIIC